MTFKPSLKLVLLLIVQFLLGGVCAVLLFTRPAVVRTMQYRVEQRWINEKQKEDVRRLKLTPAQAEKVAPTYDQLLSEVRQAHADIGRTLLEAAARQAQALEAELTPEQQKEFQKLREERLAQVRKYTRR